MPIYEYECPSCGRFEVLQKISEKTLSTCPACEKMGKMSAVKRLISAAAFHLKGSGWYKTDYASSPTAAGSKESSVKADVTNGNGDGSKKESQPVTQTPPKESKPSDTTSTTV